MIDLNPAVLREKWAAEFPSAPVTVEHPGKFVRARSINPRTYARLAAVEAECERWRAIGATLAPEPCDLDAWGGCHVHAWLETNGPCPYGRIRELLAVDQEEPTDAS